MGEQTLTINVSDIRKRLGTTSKINVDIDIEDVTVIDTALASPKVVGEVELSSIERGVTIEGYVRFDWAGDCRRCLNQVVASTQAKVFEIFQVGAPDDSADVIAFDGMHIELFPVIREIVAFALPLSPICSSDCKGPAPDLYPTISQQELEAEPPKPDPRWAALDNINFN